jgi:environmental stress-induced protein Ves
MSWSLVSLDAAAAQAWRNGGGVTRELLAWPDAADWRVRLSVADVVAAGPFSRFPGIERWFAVLEGDGVVLEMADREHSLGRTDAPLRFDGAVAVDCRLRGGPTRDFNLMAAPGCARMLRVRGEQAVRTEGRMLVAAYTHAQPAQIVFAGESLGLPPRHLAWRLLEGDGRGSVRGTDALWMEVQA